MDLVNAVEKRRSIRKFKNKRVKWADVLEAIDSALKAPLAGNINSLKFLIITDQETKNDISEYADQAWISESDLIVAVCSDEARLKTTYGERSTAYAKQQTGAAIQNFLLRITDLNLGACWIGAYLEHEIKNLLHIPDHINIEALIPVGYPDEKPKPVKKESLENCIYWDKWSIKKRPTVVNDPKTW